MILPFVADEVSGGAPVVMDRLLPGWGDGLGERVEAEEEDEEADHGQEFSHRSDAFSLLAKRRMPWAKQRDDDRHQEQAKMRINPEYPKDQHQGEGEPVVSAA